MEKGFVRKLYKKPVDAQREMLRANGLKDKDIYEQGSGSEDVDACILSFRGQRGTIKIAADFRVFGETQAQVASAVDKIEKAGIKVVDLSNPELKTVAAQLKHAFSFIAYMRRWDGNKAKARRMGANGGKMKAVHQAAKRAEAMPDDAVLRLIKKIGKALTWRDVEEVTTISTATLRRHYKG